MNIKNKCLTIIILIILSIALCRTNVYGNSDSCTLSIIPDKTQVESEEKVILVLTVSNITSSNGIAIYNGLVEYDSDIFELSVQDSSDGTWKGDLLENSVTFTKSDLEGTKEDQEIGRIVLTVKSGATIGKQSITLKNNEFAEETSFKIADVTTSIEVIGKNNNDNNNGNNNNDNNNNDDNNDNNNNNIYDDSKKDNDDNSTFVIDQKDNQTTSNNATTDNSNSEPGPIPKAGIIGIRLIVILVAIGAIIGIYSYKKYCKMKY